MSVSVWDLAFRSFVAGVLHFPTLFRLSIWGLVALVAYNLAVSFFGGAVSSLVSVETSSGDSIGAFGVESGVNVNLNVQLNNIWDLVPILIYACFIPGIFRYGADLDSPRAIPPVIYGAQSLYFLLSAGLIFLFLAVLGLISYGILTYGGFNLVVSQLYGGPSFVGPLLTVSIFGLMFFGIFPLAFAAFAYNAMATVEKTLSVKRLFTLLRGRYLTLVGLGFAFFVLLIIFAIVLWVISTVLMQAAPGFALALFVGAALQWTPSDPLTMAISVAVYSVVSVYSFGFAMVLGGDLYGRLASLVAHSHPAST